MQKRAENLQGNCMETHYKRFLQDTSFCPGDITTLLEFQKGQKSVKEGEK